LMRKTRSTKRVQLLGKVFNLEHDISADPPDFEHLMAT
jgi:hypothetical protein